MQYNIDVVDETLKIILQGANESKFQKFSITAYGAGNWIVNASNNIIILG